MVFLPAVRKASKIRAKREEGGGLAAPLLVGSCQCGSIPLASEFLTPSLLPGDGRTSVHVCTCPQPQYRPRGAVFLAGGLGRDLKLVYKAVKYSVLSQLFCVNAGSSLSIQTDLQPDKVTSTCSERLAQLDPHCPPMLLAACKRSRAGADACRLSLACLSRLPSMSCAVCRQTQKGGYGANLAIVVCHIVI